MWIKNSLQIRQLIRADHSVQIRIVGYEARVADADQYDEPKEIGGQLWSLVHDHHQRIEHQRQLYVGGQVEGVRQALFGRVWRMSSR